MISLPGNERPGDIVLGDECGRDDLMVEDECLGDIIVEDMEIGILNSLHLLGA